MSDSVGSPLFWLSFTAVVVFLLSLDLGVFHRKAHAVGFREALLWTLTWVVLSLSFGGCVHAWFGRQKGLEFFAGYLIEYALSVDNIFVFILIFSYFGVKREVQHRVLFWGILGALVMRASFILAGAALLKAFHWIMYVFGAFLVFTGIKIMREQEQEVHPEKNPVVRWFRRLMPLTAEYRGARFFVKESGKTYATPLALVLVTVETTDVVFAVDSIPAIFAVSQDPFIVYTSNICAILGLRSMYFLLAAVVSRFVYLNVGLGLVLIFVGCKMLLADFFKIPIALSLAVVAILLAASIMASVFWPPKAPANSIIPAQPLVTSGDDEA